MLLSSLSKTAEPGDDQPLEWTAYDNRLRPSDPRYEPTIYYDPVHFPTHIGVALLKDSYQRRYPDKALRMIALPAEYLKRFRVTDYRQAERHYEATGALSDAEFRHFARARPGATLYHQRHKSALFRASYLLHEMVKASGVEVFGWDLTLLDAAQDARLRTQVLNCRSRAIVGRFLGSSDERTKPAEILPYVPNAKNDGEEDVCEKFALVNRGGLLLGDCALMHKEPVYLARVFRPGHAIDEGRKDPVRSEIDGRKNRAVVSQLQFELSQDGLSTIFGGWNRHGMPKLREPANEGRGMITSAAVITWYTQVLACLRIAEAQVAVDQSFVVLNQAMIDEVADVRRKAGEKSQNGRADARTFMTQEIVERDRFDRLRTPDGRIAVWQPQDGQAGVGAWDTVRKLSRRQLFQTTLHGAPLAQDSPYYERDELLDAAYWFGDLKRRGTATLTKGVARWFKGCSEDGSEEFRDILSKRLWDAFRDAVDEVYSSGSRGDPEISMQIVYKWSPQTGAPWGVRRAKGRLIMTGPLLSFPRSGAAYWEQKSRLLVAAEASWSGRAQP